MDSTHKEDKTENCMTCGSSLRYLDSAQKMVCTDCGREEYGHIECPQGHYLCEECHNREAIKAIEDITFKTGSQDPIEIAESVIAHPGLPMLGCQHAYIAAGAFLAAIKNEGSIKITDQDIKEAFERTKKQAVGGYCGLTGICGIAPAMGASFSILLGSKCGKDVEQRTTMEFVLKVQSAIVGLTGPSCCKAYVRASLLLAVEFLKERFGIELRVESTSITCRHSHRHPHGCRETRCPYFGGKEMNKKSADKEDDPECCS